MPDVETVSKKPDVKHPLERDLEALACWINVWANESRHCASVPDGQVLSEGWRKGYEKACSDILPHVLALAPRWLDSWREGVREPRR